jgi:hypothetical protein
MSAPVLSRRFQGLAIMSDNTAYADEFKNDQNLRHGSEPNLIFAI